MIGDFEGDGTLGSTAGEKVSKGGFSVGWETAKLGYGEDVLDETYDKVYSQVDDYSENEQYYKALKDVSLNPIFEIVSPALYTLGEGVKYNFAKQTSYALAIKNNLFTLDENKNVIPSDGHFMGAELLFDMDAIKGSLLLKAQGVDEKKINAEYSSIVKQKTDALAESRKDVSGWTYYPGFIGKHIARPETVIELMSPSKIMGKTLLKGAAKAFGVEFGLGLIAETAREASIRQHMERADLEYTLWDSVENILINAGLAGALRGMGSMAVDKWNINKIRKEIPNQTDKEIFDIYVKRENDKLIKDTRKHLAVSEKARADLDEGKQVDIAEHTDIDINSKVDDIVEEINMPEEVANTNKIDPQEIQTFEKSIDEVPEVKDATDLDPYEGMATPKEAEETYAKTMDDPEIKAEYEAIRAERAALTPQAQKVKDSTQIEISGSEDAQKQATKDLFKKGIDSQYKKMSDAEIGELDAMYKADKELAPILKSVENEITADIAGVDGTSVFTKFAPELFAGSANGITYDKETGKISINPVAFIQGFALGHVSKRIMSNKKLTAVAKKEAIDYAQRMYNKLSDNPKFNYITGTMKAVESTPTKKSTILDKTTVQNYIGAKGDVHAKASKEFDTALKSVEGDYKGTAIRGMTDEEGTLSKLEVGDTYTTRGVTSIAKNMDTAKTFANAAWEETNAQKIFVKFDSFKNKPVNLGEGNRLGFKDVTDSQGDMKGNFYLEDEVVIPSGRDFEVVKKVEKDGDIYLNVREVKTTVVSQEEGL